MGLGMMTDLGKSIRYSFFWEYGIGTEKKNNTRHVETKGYINSEPGGQMRRKQQEKEGEMDKCDE